MEGKNILVFLIPIFSVLPFGGAFLKEYTSGFLKLSVIRKNRDFYAAKKIKTVSMNSFILFLLLGVVGVLIYACFWYPFTTKGILPWGDLINLCLMILRLSLTGSILASLSGIFGALFLNYYMAYGLPFVLYYMLIILKERYLPKLYCMYPVEWIQPESDWGFYNVALIVFLLLLLLITVVIHGILLRFRLRVIS